MPQPAGGIDGRDVPPRLHLLVGVDRVEQLLEPAVAARGRAHADLGQRLARRQRRARPPRLIWPASSSTPSRTPPRPICERRPEALGGRLQDQQPGRQQPHPLDIERKRGAPFRSRARCSSSRARERRPRRRARGPASRRSEAALPPTATASAGCGASIPASASATCARARPSSAGAGGSERRQRSARSPEPTPKDLHQLDVSGAVPTTSSEEPPPTSTTPRLLAGAMPERAGGTQERQPRLLARRTGSRSAARTPARIASTSAGPLAARRMAAVATP